MIGLGNLTRRLQNLLQIARTTTTCDDSGAVQTVQVKTKGAGVRDAVPVVYHYGFTAVLPLGADCVVLNVTGDSTSGCIVATGHQASRPAGLTIGQVQLYTQVGDKILLTNGGGIQITPSGGTLTINGKAVITGDCVISGKSFLGHAHSGVQAGDDDTGVPT